VHCEVCAKARRELALEQPVAIGVNPQANRVPRDATYKSRILRRRGAAGA